jgi:hypothetical protein
MKTLLLAVCIVLMTAVCFCQTTPTTPPSAFQDTTISFNLTPITLPRTGTTLAGAETDALIAFTPNNAIGETTLISAEPFIGARYERTFPSIAKWLQNHTSLTGGNFEAGITISGGVVKANKEYWGERAGIFLKYAPNGATNFNIGVDAEWNNLPGIAHNIPSIAVGPNFRF